MFHGQQIRSVLLNPHLVVGFLLLVDVVDYRGLVFLHADVDYAVAVVWRKGSGGKVQKR